MGNNGFEVNDDHSSTGRGVRFGCGGLLGVVAGLYVATDYPDLSGAEVCGFAAVGLIAVGFVSAVLGDSFWESLRDLMR
ncbi:MAG: hypothetical protein R3B40_14375 [Polyangiales bacterium]|nr:hypothetical protein [Myxococcales bacterium]MCB9659238.1 hypothetical protein [Sandaracinaceae bacterium]